MNYYEALQRRDGRWDFTRNGAATGYCREHEEGHATKEEASECYKEYLLDHKLRFSKMSNQQQRCAVCKEYTEGYAEMDTSLIVLCDKHRNREEVAKIYKAPSFVCSSW
jgi:hypothetical protein